MIHFYYWTTGYLYGKLPSAIGPSVIPMLHLYFPLTNWTSLWYTTLSYWPTGYLNGTLLSSTGPLAIPLLHYPLLLDHCFPYGTLLSSTGLLPIRMVHDPLHWISLWYTTIFYWPTEYLYCTLPLLLAH